MTDAATLWREAFEGEVLGEALFRTMADRTDDADRRAKLDVLRRLEGSTRDMLRPVLERLGVPTDGEATAAATGAGFAESAATQPWEDLLRGIPGTTAKYASMYRELRTLVGEEEHDVVDALIAHEEALCAFAERELAGEADPEGPILALPHVAA
jgi:hypothetical protein